MRSELMRRFIPSENGDHDIKRPTFTAVPNENTIISYNESGTPLSYYTSGEWDFYAYTFKRGAREHGYRIIWDESLSPEWLQGLRRFAYELLWEYERTNSTAITTVINKVQLAIRLAKTLSEHGITTPLQVDNTKRETISYVIKKRNLSRGTCEAYLSVLNSLSRASVTNLTFTSIGKLAKKLSSKSKGKKQTLAIPESIACAIYGQAISEVERYHAERHRLAEFFSGYIKLLSQAYTYASVRDYLNSYGYVSITNFEPSKYRESEENTAKFGWDTVSGFYNDIQAACGAMISSTTGMRINEWYELTPDSYQTRTFNKTTVCYLVGSVSKLKKGIPKPHAWVCAPQTELAIDVLKSISKYQRESLMSQAQTDKDKHLAQSLFLKFDVNDKKRNKATSSSALTTALKKLPHRVTYISKETGESIVGAQMLPEHLEEYQKLNNQRSENVEIGEVWPLLSHQFRRTFAVFYVRNGFGNFMQIKQQFAHVKVAMSMWYGRNSELATSLDLRIDDDIQDAIEEMNIELMTEVLSDIYLTDKKLSGGAGKSIDAKKRAGVHVFGSREEIEIAVRNGSITVVDNGTSICLNPSCGRLSCQIDPSTSALQCKDDILFDQHIEQQAQLRQRLIRRLENLIGGEINQPNMISKLTVGIKACEKLMENHDVTFSPYDFKGAA